MSRRKTGPSPAVVALVRERASEVCEVCGNQMGTQLHHRRPRGMGGTRRECSNRASACLWLCRPCHECIESDRMLALSRGRLVTQATDPLQTPVLTRHGWVRLTDAGGVEAAE